MERKPPGFVERPDHEDGGVEPARVFCDRTQEFRLVQILEAAASQGGQVRRAAEAEHGGLVEPGIENSGEGVGYGDSAGTRADAGAAGEASVGFGDIGGGLLIAGVNEADAGAARGVEERIEAVPAQS